MRKILWAEGFRYRLNVKALPGAPDIVLRPRRAAIFVHGCFCTVTIASAGRACRKRTIPIGRPRSVATASATVAMSQR
ncbi:MAG: hypothetical protein WDN76_12395 [Alphaproteobacteria bacterium]